MKEILFLTLEEVLAIHEDQISRYGGLRGVRDIGLLESAIAQPHVRFDGRYLHEGIFLMASAYAYHICLDHPFYDGNKRTALVSMLIFLGLNNIRVNCLPEEVEELIVKVANRKLSKAGIARFIQLASPKT